MKVIIASDSFKGSLCSIEVANSVASGVLNVYPSAHIEKLSVSDGGEGFISSFMQEDYKTIDLEVTNPLGEKILTFYIVKEGVVIIEMAHAAGLNLISNHNPELTTTFGVGEMIAHALDLGYQKFIIGIGGSATNDAGVGMLQALGFKFLDENNTDVGFGAKELRRILSIDSTNCHRGLKNAYFSIACDVNNPLYGENGAAYVYGKQKGADQNMCNRLDEGLRYFAQLVESKLGENYSMIGGSGAGGGIAFAILAFLNAQLKSGIELIIKHLNIEQKLNNCDFLITGEGRIDSQSFNGKVIPHLAKVAKLNKVKTIAIAGIIADKVNRCDDSLVGYDDITACFSIINSPISLEKAKQNTKDLINKNITEIFRLIKGCGYVSIASL